MKNLSISSKPFKILNRMFSTTNYACDIKPIPIKNDNKELFNEEDYQEFKKTLIVYSDQAYLDAIKSGEELSKMYEENNYFLNKNNYQDKLKSQQTKEQIEKAEAVSDIMAALPGDEMECFDKILYEETQKMKGRHPIIDGYELYDPFTIKDGKYPHIINSFLQSEAMAKIWQGKFDGFSVGGKGGNEGSKKGEEKKEEVVEEVVVERTSWDQQLKSFDPTKKIAAIKEVKAIFGFGLKEAKEIVEKAPSVLKSGVNKEEAETIIEKMKKAGCEIELV